MNDIDVLNIISEFLLKQKKILKQFPTIQNLGNCGYVLDINNKITALRLRTCFFNDLNIIANLQNILLLDLMDNDIYDIGKLSNLCSLQELILGDNKINVISALSNLYSLKKLELNINNVTDLKPVEKLNGLIELWLYNNNISNLDFLTNLTNLTKLGLNNNKISDISSLSNLTNLKLLKLGNNSITDISSLENLTALEKLYLNNNCISDINPLRNLKKIQSLNLQRNPIVSLNEWITEFNLDIKYSDKLIIEDKNIISFYDNPIETPPIEILKLGKNSIKNWFNQKATQGVDYIYESKLMIVGEPCVGKTSFAEKLIDRNYIVPNSVQKSTLGIDIKYGVSFNNLKESKKPIFANIWDFGGQQIQYTLHQYFLTSDCLYILMAEKRKELTNFDYWLNIIRLIGKNSPIIILFNEINIDSVASEVFDKKKYSELFSDLDFTYIDINLAKLDNRFDKLIEIIEQKLSTLTHIGKPVPAKWVDLRQLIESLKHEKHISIKEFIDLCIKVGIHHEDDQILILKYFHLLGIILNFYDDENLRDTIFIDLNWTIDAIYAILASNKFQQKNGIFEKQEIDNFWKSKGYKPDERIKLLRLMLKDNFDLCFKLPNSNDKYLVPLLLPNIQPIYEWKELNPLRFRYQYPFMPKGIISRLIVRLHEYLHLDIVWKEGAVFNYKDSLGQVIEKETTKEGLKVIDIIIIGNVNNRKDLLSLLRYEIEKIQRYSFPNLPYYEMIPCNCADCMVTKNPYYYSYNVL